MRAAACIYRCQEWKWGIKTWRNCVNNFTLPFSSVFHW